MNEWDGKKELLHLRAELEKLIVKLNTDLIRNNLDYDMSREPAINVRDLLIEADNEINKYRLKYRGK